MTGPTPNIGTQVDPERLADLATAYRQAADSVYKLRDDLALQAALPDAWAHDAVSVDARAHYSLQAIEGPASSLHALGEWQRELESIHDILSRMLISYHTNETNVIESLLRP